MNLLSEVKVPHIQWLHFIRMQGSAEIAFKIGQSTFRCQYSLSADRANLTLLSGVVNADNHCLRNSDGLEGHLWKLDIEYEPSVHSIPEFILNALG